MPDWIVHVALAWTLCRILRFKYPQFDTPNTILVMVGALIPDVMKIGVIFEILGHNWWDYVNALHQPVGSILVAGLASLFFQKKKEAFLFFSLGVVTHYALDLLLMQVSGGIYWLFPFSWVTFSLDLVPNDDYYITVVALGVALLVHMIVRWKEPKKTI